MTDTFADMPPISPLSYKDAQSDLDGFAQALGQSFEKTGFAIVKDHPIDAYVIERALSDTKAFFALPEAAKRKHYIPDGGGQRGYTPFQIENAKNATAKDLKEFWHRGRDLPPNHPYQSVMPDNVSVPDISGFDENTHELYDALDTMGNVLLEAIAQYLGLERNWFAPSVNYGNSILRLLHYPPIEHPTSAMRAAAHEDINVITLLLGAEEAGLQVKTNTGNWLPINPPPGALVVNIGDMLQRLTNHVLPSTTHRVVNPEPDRVGHSRYSTPFFLHFNPDFKLQTLDGCISQEKPNLYPVTITAHEYLLERLSEIGLRQN